MQESECNSLSKIKSDGRFTPRNDTATDIAFQGLLYHTRVNSYFWHFPIIIIAILQILHVNPYPEYLFVLVKTSYICFVDFKISVNKQTDAARNFL